MFARPPAWNVLNLSRLIYAFMSRGTQFKSHLLGKTFSGPSNPE